MEEHVEPLAEAVGGGGTTAPIMNADALKENGFKVRSQSYIFRDLPDGRRIIVNLENGTMQVWRAGTGFQNLGSATQQNLERQLGQPLNATSKAAQVARVSQRPKVNTPSNPSVISLNGKTLRLGKPDGRGRIPTSTVKISRDVDARISGYVERNGRGGSIYADYGYISGSARSYQVYWGKGEKYTTQAGALKRVAALMRKDMNDVIRKAPHDLFEAYLGA